MPIKRQPPHQHDQPHLEQEDQQEHHHYQEGEGQEPPNKRLRYDDWYHYGYYQPHDTSPYEGYQPQMIYNEGQEYANGISGYQYQFTNHYLNDDDVSNHQYTAEEPGTYYEDPMTSNHRQDNSTCPDLYNFTEEPRTSDQVGTNATSDLYDFTDDPVTGNRLANVVAPASYEFTQEPSPQPHPSQQTSSSWTPPVVLSTWTRDISSEPLHTRTCPVCGRIVQFSSQLRRHLKVHRVKRPPLNCNNCGLQFTKAEDSEHGEEEPGAIDEPRWSNCCLKTLRDYTIKRAISKHKC